MNADLVTINTVEENSFVLNLTRVSYFWIGLNDVSEEGTFVWASGSKSAYRKWKSLEPNDNNKNEDCVEATRQSDWNDVPCNFLMSYVCEKGYQCGNLMVPHHGNVSEHNVTIGSIANFSCEVGYRLVGNSTLTCWSNSIWSSNTPTCEIVNCGALPTLPNGQVHVNHTIYKSHTSFTCKDGYVLVGASSAICLVTGTWSEEFPLCIGANVKYLANLINTTSVSDLLHAMNSLSLYNFTSEIAMIAVTKLKNLTSSQKMTSSQVINTINVLDILVTLQEKVLESEGNLTMSNEFVDTYVEVSDNLLSTQTPESWLSLDSNDGAPAFLESMEKFSRVTAYSKATEDNQTRVFASGNVVLTVSTVNVSELTVKDVSFPVNVTTTNITNTMSRSAVRLPANVLLDLLNLTGASRLAVSSLLYKNLQKFMPPNTIKSISTTSPHIQSVGDLRKNSNKLPHSSIVSLSIVKTGEWYNSSNAKLSFHEPVYINYTNVNVVENGKYTCSYWQYGLNSNPGYWSSSGVTTDVISDTNILCSTFHLTSFSVLVAVQTAAMSDTLSYITYIGCGVSLVCLFIMLIVRIYFRSHLHFEKNFVLINFVVALMLALAVFTAGIDQSSNKQTCRIMTFLMHYFFLAVFCWMLCEGIFHYLMLVVVFVSGKKTYLRRFFALGWGLPIVIVAISFGLRFDDYGNYDYCFLTHHNGLIYAFIVPMILILLANLVVLIIAVKMVISRVSADNERITTVKSGLRALATLLPILGLTWAIGVFAVDSLSLPLAYLFTIFNSFQGLFVLIFHCVLDKQVQNAFKKIRQRWSSGTQLAKPKVEDSSSTEEEELRLGDTADAVLKSRDGTFEMKEMELDAQAQQRQALTKSDSVAIEYQRDGTSPPTN